MNCPSRTDELTDEGWNQSPPALAADLTTRSDLNGIANLRLQRDHLQPDAVERHESPEKEILEHERHPAVGRTTATLTDQVGGPQECTDKRPQFVTKGSNPDQDANLPKFAAGFVRRSGQILLKFSKFVGPGFMVSVAYIDPGNYSTDVAAGASDRFRLLFVVLLSNVCAIVLQVLAVRLGTITGLNLAEHCRLFLPKWLNISLYILAEAAIIATDIAEV